MKKFNKAVILSSAIVAGLIFTASSQVQADTANDNATKVNTTTTSAENIYSVPQLSKWGYIVNVNSAADPIYVGKAN